ASGPLLAGGCGSRHSLPVVRRLPVVQTAASEDAEAMARPAAHWVAIGVALMVALFLPLSMLGVAVAQAGFKAPAAGALFALSASSVGSGAVLGRFGLKLKAPGAALAGALGGAALLLLSRLGGNRVSGGLFLFEAGLLIGLGALFCFAGFRLGHRRRP
ncbi:MAG TPA: hypothetical protein VFQ61_09690, partial [Polyangiaceae bacterium]|nr:hypothetical protein [Polyangiaceae bacterium]